MLLYFLNHKDEYLNNLRSQKKALNVVKNKLSNLSKIEMILSFSEKSPSIKRELELKLSDDSQSIIKQFFREINKIFRKFDYHSFSTYEISKQLKEILKQIETADDAIKIAIIWKITDGVLYQLNEYGMQDLPLENLAINTMGMLVEILNSASGLDKHREEIQNKLEQYCKIGNCGIVDDICEAAYEITDENDW